MYYKQALEAALASDNKGMERLNELACIAERYNKPLQTVMDDVLELAAAENKELQQAYEDYANGTFCGEELLDRREHAEFTG